ncbi:MAG: hypothetical protein JOY64_02135 [Alphaproteobacteria bacterium]|nr:hypothetical protein [Alphaproteobacteria bacterium]MBV8406401.1 hypothetical protein [Alphaproteobacteria bacterium]
MTDFAIPVAWYDFVNYYPTVTKTLLPAKRPGDKPRHSVKLKDPGGSLNGELDDWVSGLFNENPSYTTCCIQMSHAINMAFLRSDPTKMVGLQTYRRATHGFRIRGAGNREFHYVASVDEMKRFLDDTFAEGVEITSKDDIDDQPGIIVFMGTVPYGIHTEIWTGDDFHQHWMKGHFGHLKKPKVWFWSLGDPTRPDV